MERGKMPFQKLSEEDAYQNSVLEPFFPGIDFTRLDAAE
jgi:hypothetical protein